MPALELVDEGGVSNQTEAEIVHLLLSLLIKVFKAPNIYFLVILNIFTHTCLNFRPDVNPGT